MGTWYRRISAEQLMHLRVGIIQQFHMKEYEVRKLQLGWALLCKFSASAGVDTFMQIQGWTLLCKFSASWGGHFYANSVPALGWTLLCKFSASAGVDTFMQIHLFISNARYFSLSFLIIFPLIVPHPRGGKCAI